MAELERVEDGTGELRNRLKTHRLYKNLSTLNALKVFTRYHVFAVWDFMSLLKALQLQLTTVSVPWTPPKNPALARFVNEMVWAEETDLNELGQPKSHFEMYLDAMVQMGVNTEEIKQFINHIQAGKTVNQTLLLLNLDPAIRDFIQFTFKVIETQKPHIIAAAFTFGREDLIPCMFIEMVKEIESKQKNASCKKFIHYLQRHIEIDGEEHGFLSKELLVKLCDGDLQKWDEVLNVSKQALKQRIKLWDSIVQKISIENTLVLESTE